MRNRHERISETLIRELDKIKQERMKGVDNKYPRQISTAKLTDGMVRCAEWEAIRSKLIREPRREDLR